MSVAKERSCSATLTQPLARQEFFSVSSRRRKFAKEEIRVITSLLNALSTVQDVTGCGVVSTVVS
jgi:hypothetical protein